MTLYVPLPFSFLADTLSKGPAMNLRSVRRSVYVSLPVVPSRYLAHTPVSQWNSVVAHSALQKVVRSPPVLNGRNCAAEAQCARPLSFLHSPPP